MRYEIRFVLLTRMTRVLAIFFTLITLFPTLLRLGSVADYLIRYDRYVTELCKNKDKPASCCKGKCKLGENLVKAEKQEFPTKPILPIQKKQDVPAILLDFSEESSYWLAEKASGLCHDAFLLEEGFRFAVFHPPGNPTTLV